MMEYYELVKNLDLNGHLAVWCYWLPLVLCVIGYTVRTWQQVQDLRIYRADPLHSKYVDSLTIGQILWRIILSVTPGANILALSFDLAFDMLGKIGRKVEAIISFQLVKNRLD